ASPLNRVQKQSAPGDAWKGNENNNSDKTRKVDYKFNDANEHKLYKANTTTLNTNGVDEATLGNNAGTVYYPANHLYKTIIKDENWVSGNAHTTVEFTDKEGRVVLKRTYVKNQDENSSGYGNLETADTYYVYDMYGNLSF